MERIYKCIEGGVATLEELKEEKEVDKLLVYAELKRQVLGFRDDLKLSHKVLTFLLPVQH